MGKRKANFDKMSTIVVHFGGKNAIDPSASVPDGKRPRPDPVDPSAASGSGASDEVDHGKKHMSIIHTGVVSGEEIVGRMSCQYGVRMQLFYDEADDAARAFMMPGSDAADIIRAKGWGQELVQTRRFSSTDSGLDAALAWIQTHASAKKTAEYSFEKVPTLRVRFLSLGVYDERTDKANKNKKSVLANPDLVDEETQSWLVERDRDYAEVAARLPFLVNRITLFGLAHEWTLYDGDPILTLGNERDRPPVLDPVSGRILSGADALPAGGRVLRRTFANGDTVHIALHAAGARPAPSVLLGNVLEAANMQHCDQCDALHEYTSKMAASELKSLLQKIIRFGAPRVHADAIDISAEHALAVTMASLASLRGYFLPDLGVYVTGVHALAKRLMVILMEDAAPEDLRAEEVAALAACALLSQNDQRWFPSMDMLGAWVRLACRARGSRARFDYDAQHGMELPAVSISNALTDHDHYGVVSATLDEVGAFPSDKGLARHIATANLRPVAVDSVPSASMPLWHCYDQVRCLRIRIFIVTQRNLDLCIPISISS